MLLQYMKGDKMVGRPYENSRLAKYVQKRVLELRPGKTQAQIAQEAGFLTANMVAMLKRGASKLPLDRVPGLAKALECDERMLFNMALEQITDEGTATAIKKIFGTVVTENEVAWLGLLREASDNTDPAPTKHSRKVVRAIFGKVAA
ncbi:MAG: XRE family transcriptional regulator [Paracoccaceae bacterium]